jgi:hypothetical protein
VPLFLRLFLVQLFNEREQSRGQIVRRKSLIVFPQLLTNSFSGLAPIQPLGGSTVAFLLRSHL